MVVAVAARVPLRHRPQCAGPARRRRRKRCFAQCSGDAEASRYPGVQGAVARPPAAAPTFASAFLSLLDAFQNTYGPFVSHSPGEVLLPVIGA